jgi:hypothetical protein
MPFRQNLNLEIFNDLMLNVSVEHPLPNYQMTLQRISSSRYCIENSNKFKNASLIVDSINIQGYKNFLRSKLHRQPYLNIVKSPLLYFLQQANHRKMIKVILKNVKMKLRNIKFRCTYDFAFCF